jgi:hypothetical protein
MLAEIRTVDFPLFPARQSPPLEHTCGNIDEQHKAEDSQGRVHGFHVYGYDEVES